MRFQSHFNLVHLISKLLILSDTGESVYVFMFIKGKLFQSDPQLIQIGTLSFKQGKYCYITPAENLVVIS